MSVQKYLKKLFIRNLLIILRSTNFFQKCSSVIEKNRSTELFLSDNIRKAVGEGHIVGVLYVDLSKAFDTLSHSALLEKLKSFGITGDSHNWFTDYLFNRKQFCVVENCESKLLNITCGVPQGSILGPLLFLMFFNDFENA